MVNTKVTLSGWQLDNRGGIPRTQLDGGYGNLNDISTTEGTAVIREFTRKENLDFEHIYLIRAPFFEEHLVHAVEETLNGLGYHNYTWVPTGCVITCHGGPGAFGIVGVSK